MEKIILTYDEANPLAQKTLAFILSLGIFKKEIDTDGSYNQTTIQAIEEAKEGKATKISLEGFRKELYSLI